MNDASKELQGITKGIPFVLYQIYQWLTSKPIEVSILAKDVDEVDVTIDNLNIFFIRVQVLNLFNISSQHWQ